MQTTKQKMMWSQFHYWSNEYICVSLCSIKFLQGCKIHVIHCEQDLLANLIELSPKNARHKFRQCIFEAWDWKCAYCDKELNKDTATIDHILPKFKGGHNVKSNMISTKTSNSNSIHAIRSTNIVEIMIRRRTAIIMIE